MFHAAEALVNVDAIAHKRQVFSHSLLLYIAGEIREGHIDVKIDERVTYEAGVHALYLTEKAALEDLVTKEVIDWLPGNTLYLPILPGSGNFTRATLAHEAVHISADLHGESEILWDHEEFAFFVGAFIYARLDEPTARRYAREDNDYLIGCLASDFFNKRRPKVRAISSEQLNKPMSFDYTKEGGIKGRANPYTALVNMVRSLYPDGEIDGKPTSILFNGM